MNNKVIVIAELMFALVFIVVMAHIVSTVVDFGKNANNTLVAMEQAAEEADLSAYDNATISGDIVIATINKMKETNNGIKLSYLVKIGSSYKKYGYCAINSSSGSNSLYKKGETSPISGISVTTRQSSYTYYSIHTPGADGFISPVEEYTSEILYNGNFAVIGILFTRK